MKAKESQDMPLASFGATRDSGLTQCEARGLRPERPNMFRQSLKIADEYGVCESWRWTAGECAVTKPECMCRWMAWPFCPICPPWMDDAHPHGDDLHADHRFRYSSGNTLTDTSRNSFEQLPGQSLPCQVATVTLSVKTHTDGRGKKLWVRSLLFCSCLP